MRAERDLRVLSDVAEVILGQSPPGTTYNVDKIGLPFFQGKAEFGDIYPSPVKWCSEPTKVAEADDVLISVRAPVGPTNLCPSKACIGRGLAALRPRSGVSPKYLLYAVRATVSELEKQGTGSTFAAISGSQLRSHRLPVVTPIRQTEIVRHIEQQYALLNAATEALNRAQANLKRYRASVLKAACEGRLVPTEAELARQEDRELESGRQLVDGILKRRREIWTGSGSYKHPNPAESFPFGELPEGWTCASVEELTDQNRAATYGVIKLGLHVPDGIPVLRSSDIRHLRLDLKGLKKVSPVIAGAYRRTFLKGKEVLVTVRGTLGGVVAVPEECSGYNISREVAMLAMVDERMAKFVAIMIAAEPLQRWLAANSKGVAYTGINIEALKRLPVPVPPLDEQNRIVEEVERRLRVADSLAASLLNADQTTLTLRQSILHRAFS